MGNEQTIGSLRTQILQLRNQINNLSNAASPKPLKVLKISQSQHRFAPEIGEDNKYDSVLKSIFECRKEIKELKLRMLSLSEQVTYNQDLIDVKLKLSDSKKDFSLPFVSSPRDAKSSQQTFENPL